MKTVPKNLLPVFALVLLSGCGAEKAAQEPKKEPIFNKTTQDIGEFDPTAGKQISDGKYNINLVTTMTGNAQQYGTAVGNLVKPQVDRLVQMFKAINGRYPKDYQEFMDEVIRKGNVKLPMLPHGSSYQYDAQNHVLVIVKDK